MANKYEYQNPVDRLDELIDKLARGILPLVDEVTEKEMYLRMKELSEDDDIDEDEDDGDALNELANDVKEMRQKVEERKRKATRKDIIIIKLTDEQKAKLREEMETSYVRSEPSSYNIDEATCKQEQEYLTLKKRASKIRRCYYHADEWINAVKILLDLVEYDKRNYPWLTDKEYYQAFWSGEIQLNVIRPILYADYHTPIKDPETLLGIFSGEITIEEEDDHIDASNRVKLKDDKIVKVPVVSYTEAELDYMQDMASRGYDTPMNLIFKEQHKSLYDRFLPASKSHKADPARVKAYMSYINDSMKVKDHEFSPYDTNDIILYIHELNKGGLNTSLNTNTTKWLNALAADPNKTELRYDNSFTNDTVVNAEAAIKEAMIMANIKSLGNITQR